MEISKVITNELTTLIQKENYVGKVYYIDYDIAFIATHDHYKEKVGGIPLNSFLNDFLREASAFFATSHPKLKRMRDSNLSQ